MAGFFLLGVPVLGGVVGGTVLQASMRALDAPIQARIAAELGLIGTGALCIYKNPPGGANTGKNWDLFIWAGSLVTSGLFAMTEGIFLNLAYRNHVVVSCAGLFLMFVAGRYLCHAGLK